MSLFVELDFRNIESGRLHLIRQTKTLDGIVGMMQPREEPLALRLNAPTGIIGLVIDGWCLQQFQQGHVTLLIHSPIMGRSGTQLFGASQNRATEGTLIVVKADDLPRNLLVVGILELEQLVQAMGGGQQIGTAILCRVVQQNTGASRCTVDDKQHYAPT